MDIFKAQGIIQSKIQNTQDELDALQISLDILNQTFAADISAVAVAQKEGDDQRVQVAALSQQVVDLQSQLKKAVDAAAADVATADFVVTPADNI